MEDGDMAARAGFGDRADADGYVLGASGQAEALRRDPVRVDALKGQLDDGSYEVRSDRVAAAILARLGIH